VEKEARRWRRDIFPVDEIPFYIAEHQVLLYFPFFFVSSLFNFWAATNAAWR